MRGYWKPESPTECPSCGSKDFETNPLYASDGLDWYKCRYCGKQWSDYDIIKEDEKRGHS